MKQIWFKRKLYGWGWYPATWQGWGVTLVYVFVAIALGTTIDDTSSPREIAFTFVLPLAILTVLFIRIALTKGESPRWQWGKKRK